MKALLHSSSTEPADHKYIKTALVLVSTAIAIRVYSFYWSDTVNFEYEAAVFDICVVFFDSGSSSLPGFIVAFAPSVIVNGGKLVAEEQAELALVVVIDLDIFKLRTEWHFGGVNSLSSVWPFAHGQGGQNKILSFLQALDLLISAYDSVVDAISDVLGSPLYLVCVIRVVQSIVEVKAPLVVERFPAHPGDEGRVVWGDDVDRVSVLEEIFIEPVIEIIEVEWRNSALLLSTFHASHEATVHESV